jgi:hypothetical protein
MRNWRGTEVAGRDEAGSAGFARGVVSAGDNRVVAVTGAGRGGVVAVVVGGFFWIRVRVIGIVHVISLADVCEVGRLGDVI